MSSLESKHAGIDEIAVFGTADGDAAIRGVADNGGGGWGAGPGGRKNSGSVSVVFGRVLGGMGWGMGSFVGEGGFISVLVYFVGVLNSAGDDSARSRGFWGDFGELGGWGKVADWDSFRGCSGGGISFARVRDDFVGSKLGAGRCGRCGGGFPDKLARGRGGRRRWLSKLTIWSSFWTLEGSFLCVWLTFEAGMCCRCVLKLPKVLGGEGAEKAVVWAKTRSLSMFLGRVASLGAFLDAVGVAGGGCCCSYGLGISGAKLGGGG